MQRIADVHVSQPALRLKFVPDNAAAADAIYHFTRAVAEQPYRDPGNYLQAHGGAKLGGAAFQHLSRASRTFAACLGKLSFISVKQAPIIAQHFSSLGRLMSEYMDSGRCDANQLLCQFSLSQIVSYS